MKNVKINILSPGRFHVLDLARELNKNGFDVKFYSYIPRKRAVLYGLSPECNVSFLLPLLPFLLLERIAGRAKWTIQFRRVVLDFLCSIFMRKCDIQISMSGEFAKSNRRVKKDGGILIIERGSKHILDQKQVLESIPSLAGKTVIPKSNVKREIDDYNNADYISIAAKHVKESFLKYGYSESKLFVNPYGVELSMFKPMPCVHKKYDIIMTGSWSYQKGCDLIISAFIDTEITILHVGSIGDCQFPIAKNFFHVDKVEQTNLMFFYNLAKIFVMPSRQDGFGMVYTQAMACNLPIVGSVDSGAPDLKLMADDSSYIIVINSYTPESIKRAVEEALNLYNTLGAKRYAGKAIDNLSWDAYGKRYANFLNQIAVKS